MRCLFFIFLFLSPVLLAAQHDSVYAADSINVSSKTDSAKVLPSDFHEGENTKLFSQYPPDTGIASWYGNKWNGRMTASGQIFHPNELTAAHKTLPFGTLVKVTNLSNDSVVIVKITDRLPKKSTRSIDLTPAAAKKLGFYSKGLTKVKMEVVGQEPIIKFEKKKVKKK
ncbi:MAG: septal ring lytic transglycosylase RlpA family protein [Bacteroidetes bacterium]|nr:septal ring lytic transglycosylase RlpA family protein [Bacteroidota bacterium]